MAFNLGRKRYATIGLSDVAKFNYILSADVFGRITAHNVHTKDDLKSHYMQIETSPLKSQRTRVKLER